MSVLDELKWRGLLEACTDEEGLRRRLAQGPITLYCGFDPTAESLHVGNLVPLLGLRRFQVEGHRPIAVAGGATGSIGDPSGKSRERRLLSKEELRANIEKVKLQLQKLLDFTPGSAAARLVDNADWLAPLPLLDFLREVGKHFSVGMMIAKESVRARLGDPDRGISYTEFSYMLLQAYDFYHLRKSYDCELQVGGSDQWGNITAGIDLCRKKLDAAAYGLTFPLVTDASGAKFGKTEAGAVWLDPERTSVYQFYQFWVRTDDRDVIRYLKYFTFLPREEIEALAAQHAQRPEARQAHKALARELTAMIHGPDAAEDAARASEALFGGSVEGLSPAALDQIAGEAPTVLLPTSAFEGEGLPLVEALVRAGLCPSKGQARKDIAAGGVYVNNARRADVRARLRKDELLHGKCLLLRKGKRNYALLRIEG